MALRSCLLLSEQILFILWTCSLLGAYCRAEQMALFTLSVGVECETLLFDWCLCTLSRNRCRPYPRPTSDIFHRSAHAELSGLHIRCRTRRTLYILFSDGCFVFNTGGVDGAKISARCQALILLVLHAPRAAAAAAFITWDGRGSATASGAGGRDLLAYVRDEFWLITSWSEIC